LASILLRGHISARVLTGIWVDGEASDVQASFAGISYVVFGSYLSLPFTHSCANGSSRNAQHEPLLSRISVDIDLLHFLRQHTPLVKLLALRGSYYKFIE